MPVAVVLPVGRFSPTSGLFVDRTGNSVQISGAMELYGPEANGARAVSIESTINRIWTRSFPDGFSISCKVTVKYRGSGTSQGEAAQIETLKSLRSSEVNMSDRSMTLNADEPDAFTWTAAHEFGHVIGMDDRYTESIMSQIRGMFGGTRSTTASPGYQANLMAVHAGVMESKNVRDLAIENEPSAHWINDDEHVRDWVNHHSTADIRRLSSADKLKAIATLMGGWVSDADVTAIARICSSVNSRSEATAIRSGVDVLDFSSHGQRTTVRVALAGMP